MPHFLQGSPKNYFQLSNVRIGWYQFLTGKVKIQPFSFPADNNDDNYSNEQ